MEYNSNHAFQKDPQKNAATLLHLSKHADSFKMSNPTREEKFRLVTNTAHSPSIIVERQTQKCTE
jgi:hypothetical protein